MITVFINFGRNTAEFDENCFFEQLSIKCGQILDLNYAS